ncbi:MAG: HD domain-containing protein [Thermodesulfobacteria bacterium]|nr:HD domain-containing protein [Thermodesulfobacteriota bacterium]
MVRDIFINLNNFFLSVSDAIDLSNPALFSHQLRTTYIAWQLAKELLLPLETMKRIYVAALFHDIGALDPREKRRLHSFEEENLAAHCLKGEKLFESIWLLKPAARIVRYHHHPWKEWQKQGRNLNDEDVLESQILYLADYVERLLRRDVYVLHQSEGIIAQIKSLCGDRFHPELVDCFLTLAARESFWLDMDNPRIYSILLHYGPLEKVNVDLESVARLATFFSKIIDFRSRFTATHSTGVSSAAIMIARYFGLTEREVTLMHIAGSLHDLGKLAIPNYILEKPGPLNREEFRFLKQHVYHTYMILNSIDGFEQIAEWAAFHHERLDGSGYPFRLSAGDLSVGARIMAVADVFTALTEDRPYRQALPVAEVRSIMERMADNGAIDRVFVELLFDHYQDISAYIEDRRARSLQNFEEYQGLSV